MLFAKKFHLELRLQIAIALILFSFVLVLAGLDRHVALYLRGFGEAGAFFAGAFYTFGVTTPFSMVVILEIMELNNPLLGAASASFAAATVDCFLFLAVRQTLESNSKKLLKQIRRRFENASSLYPVAGFFVFGMPLPDELGLALMGMTTIEPLKLWATVFLAKFFTLLIFWMALAP